MTKLITNNRKKYSYRAPVLRQPELDELLELSGMSFNSLVTEAIFGRNRFRPAEIIIASQTLVQATRIADLHIGIVDEIKLAGAVTETLVQKQLLEEIGRCRNEELIAIRTAVMSNSGFKT